MSVTYDNHSCSSNNINSLVEKISEKYKTVKVVLLLDQVIPRNEAGYDNNQSDWSTLSNSTPNVDVLISLSALGRGFKNNFYVTPPHHTSLSQQFSKQLLRRIRNNYETSMLINHIEKNNPYIDGYINGDKNVPMTPDNFPPGRTPTWIRKDQTANDEELLQRIKKDHVFEHERVAFFCNLKKSDQRLEIISEWCLRNGWECLNQSEIHLEANVAVLYEVNVMPEMISAGRNAVIIVTNTENTINVKYFNDSIELCRG